MHTPSSLLVVEVKLTCSYSIYRGLILYTILACLRKSYMFVAYQSLTIPRPLFDRTEDELFSRMVKL